MFAGLPASGMREANPNRRRHTGTAEAMESSGDKSVGFGSVGGRHSGVGATPLGGRVEGNPEVDAKSLVISFRGKEDRWLKRATETCEEDGIARLHHNFTPRPTDRAEARALGRPIVTVKFKNL